MLSPSERAVRGGVLLERLRGRYRQTGLASRSPPTPSLPLWRRLGRMALRLVRPLAVPLLVRLQRLMTVAVDNSATAASLSRLERHVVDLSREAAERARRWDALEHRLDQLHGTVEASFAAAAAERSRRWDALERRLDQLHGTVEASFAAAAAERRGATERVLTTPLRSAVVAGGDDVILMRGPDGWLLAPREDYRLVAALAESGGCLEPGTRELVRALLEPGDLVVDVGANIGLHSLAMGHTVGPAGRVVALEPNPRLAELLRRNMALNDLAERVDIMVSAAGATEGLGTLRVGEVLGEGTLIGDPPGEVRSIEVPITTLDTVLRGRRPSLVKIDAEGMELDVVAGLRATIAAAERLALIVEFGPAHLRRAGIAIPAWLGRFSALGLEGWLIDEFGQPGALTPLEERGLSAVASANVLFVKGGLAAWPSLRRLAL